MSITSRILAMVALLGAATLLVAGLSFKHVLEARRALERVSAQVERAVVLLDVEQAMRPVAVQSAGLAASRAGDDGTRLVAALDALDAAVASFPVATDDEDAVVLVRTTRRLVGNGRALVEGVERGELDAGRATGELRLQLAEVARLSDVVGNAITDRAERLQAAVVAAGAWAGVLGLSTAFGAALLAGVAAVLMTRRHLARPLDALADAMERLAAGEATANPAGLQLDGVLGRAARATEGLGDLLRDHEARLALVQAPKGSMEEGTQRTEELVALLEADVASVVRSLSASAGRLSTSAATLRRSADKGNTQAGRVSSAAEETSGNVQAVASAAEELAASAQEIGSQVAQSTLISMEALRKAEDATSVVEGLARSARKIGQVVDLIGDIASQTNLLALNATIEAARAGDAGKGFAVVAMEVKSLAEQTGNATKEISSQIGAVQLDVDRVVGAIQSLKASFAQANELAAGVASAIEEQAAATGAIAQSVHQAAVSTQEVSTTILDVSKAANDTGHGANEIVDAADELTTYADTLKTRMASFIASMRSTAA